MLDKLHLSLFDTGELHSGKVMELLFGQYDRASPVRNAYYGDGVVLKRIVDRKDQHLITVQTRPQFGNNLKIEINPSHFINYDTMISLLSLLCDPNDLEISRIDHSVDVSGKSVRDIRSALIFPRKQSYEEYGDLPGEGQQYHRSRGNHLETFYLGGKRSDEKLVVYDRGYKSERLPRGQKTRIELQHKKSKVKFKKFSDLIQYSTYCPFEKFKFIKMDPSLPRTMDLSHKPSELAHYLDELGAHSTYKKLNVHSNFNRDYGPLLIDNEDIPNLDLYYQHNLTNFFLSE